MGIVIDTVYKPKTYQEMMAPIMEYQKAYELQQQQNQALSDSANAFYDIVNSENSDEAKRMYTQYTNDLQQFRDDLLNMGINQKTKANAMSLRDRYQKEITPIEQAYKAYQEQIKLADARYTADQKMIQQDPRAYGLDGFLHNPNRKINYLSGAQVVKDSAAIYQNLAKKILQDPRAKHLLYTNNQYWQLAQKKGIDPNDITAFQDMILNSDPKEIIKALSSSDDGKRYLATGFKQLASAYGDLDWMTEDQKKDFFNYIGMGAWSALGDDQYKELQDTWMAACNSARASASNGPTGPHMYDFQLRPESINVALGDAIRQQSQERAKKIKSNPLIGGSVSVDDDGNIKLVDPKALQKQVDNANNIIKGRWDLFNKAAELYRDATNQVTSTKSYTPGLLGYKVQFDSYDTDSNIEQLISQLKSTEPELAKAIELYYKAPESIKLGLMIHNDYNDSIYNMERKQHSNFADAAKLQWIDIPISEAQSKDATRSVMKAIGNSYANGIDYDLTKGRIIKKKSEMYRTTDLADFKVLSFKSSPLSDNIIAQMINDNGETRYIMIPEGGFNVNNAMAANNAAETLLDKYESYFIYDIDGTKIIDPEKIKPTPEDIELYKQKKGITGNLTPAQMEELTQMKETQVYNILVDLNKDHTQYVRDGVRRFVQEGVYFDPQDYPIEPSKHIIQ